jgi:RNA polymerase sigma factor (sigma-70 family)
MRTFTPDSERSSLNQYLELIAREPLMTAEEEIHNGKLVQRMQQLQKLDRDLTPAERREVKKGVRAKNRFVKANLRLVVYIVKRNSTRTQFLDMLDLIQEASIGLMRAAEMFDPGRGYKFSTYAYWWCRQAVSRAILQQDMAIRRPTTVAELAAKLTKLQHQETQRLGRTPTVNELAEAAGVARKELDLLAERGRGCISLDQRICHDDEVSLIDVITDRNQLTDADRDYELDYSMKQALIEMAMLKLSEIEQVFLTRRYGLDGEEGSTYAALAKEVGVSRERVRQITDRAVRKLRFYMSHPDQEPEGQASEGIDVRTKVVAPSPRSKGRLVPEALDLLERQAIWSSPVQQCA